MVLDAAFEPSGDSEFDQWATQLVGFEHAFNDWAAWCEEGNDCAFNAVDVGARWDALFDSLDANPLTAADGRTRQPGRARDGDHRGDVQQGRVAGARPRRSPTPRPATATPCSPSATATTQRNPDGTYNTIRQSGQVIRCASGLAQTYPADPAALLAQIKAAAPRFARNDAHRGLRRRLHGDHPRPSEARRPGVHRHGTDPRRRRASTTRPRRSVGPQELTAEMGPSATLLTYSGEGHGALAVVDVRRRRRGRRRSATSRCPPPARRAPPIPTSRGRRSGTSCRCPTASAPRSTIRRSAGALGLTPSQAYSGAWALTGDAQTVATEYQQALQAHRHADRRPAATTPASLVVPALSPDGTPVAVAIFPADACWRPTTTPTCSSTCRPARASCWCSPTRPGADPPCGGAPCSSWWGSRWPRPTSCSRARRRSSSRWPRRPAPPGRRPISRAAREPPATPR